MRAPRQGSLLHVLWPVAKEAFLEIEFAAHKVTATRRGTSAAVLKRVPVGWAKPELVAPELIAPQRASWN